jgi:hypothetical protein
MYLPNAYRGIYCNNFHASKKIHVKIVETSDSIYLKTWWPAFLEGTCHLNQVT